MKRSVGVVVTGLVLLAAGATLLVVARGLPDPDDLLTVAMIVSEFSIACFWWPLAKRVPMPMSRWATVAARAFGVAYMGTLATIGTVIVSGWYEASEAVPWFVGVLVVPFIGAALLLISRPRLLVIWCACGTLVPALAFAMLCFVFWGGGKTSEPFPSSTLLFSSFPNGMLIGWFFAYFLGRLRVPRIA